MTAKIEYIIIDNKVGAYGEYKLDKVGDDHRS